MVGRGGSSEYSYWKGEMDARQVKQQVVPTKAREREGVVSSVSCLEETEPVDQRSEARVTLTRVGQWC